MVTLQILVLPFLVRVRVAQRSQKRVCSSRANSLSFLYILPHPYIDNAGGGPGRHPNRLKPPDKMRACSLPCAGDRLQARTCRLCCTSVCHFDGCRIDAEGVEELDAAVDHRLQIGLDSAVENLTAIDADGDGTGEINQTIVEIHPQLAACGLFITAVELQVNAPAFVLQRGGI